MKIYLNFFIFVQLICFIHSITEYEYDYGTDFNDKDLYLDDHHREKWHHHQKFYGKFSKCFYYAIFIFNISNYY